MANVEMATLEKPPKVEETVFVAKTTRIKFYKIHYKYVNVSKIINI